MPRRNVYQYSDFANKFYQTATSNCEKFSNFVFSPFAVQSALGLAYIGAGGKTAQELRDGLHISYQPKVEVCQHFLNVFRECESNSVIIANKIFMKKDSPVNKDFKEMVEKFMASEVENIDINNELSLKVINFWVATKTSNKISQFMDSLPSDCRLLLVSAIVVKATWLTPFVPVKTRWTEFYVSATEKKRFKMMHGTIEAGTAVLKNVEATAINIPCNESEVSFLIVLPKSKTGLKEVEENMLGEDILETMKSLTQNWVKVKIPKFKLDALLDMNQSLKNMDMPTMFTSKAQFEEMATIGQDLRITNVLHRAYFDLNETGFVEAEHIETEPPKTGILTEEEFVCDRPFWFAIMLGHMMLMSGRFTGLDTAEES